MPLPSFLKKYFWDVDFKKIDPEKSKMYIAERLLEHGDARALFWFFQNIGVAHAKRVLREQRGLSPRSANFWASYLNVPKHQVVCLKKSYLAVRKSHWPY